MEPIGGQMEHNFVPDSSTPMRCLADSQVNCQSKFHPENLTHVKGFCFLHTLKGHDQREGKDECSIQQ